MRQPTNFTPPEGSWAPPVELQTSRPRAVELTAGGIGIVVLAIVFGLGSIAAAAALSRKASREAKASAMLRESGQETDAVITRLWRSADKEKRRHVAYEFSYASRVQPGQAAVPRAIWPGLAEGSRLRVRFVPADPSLNHPAGWPLPVTPAWLPFAAAGILAAVALLFVVLLRRQINLLADGRATMGVVTGYASTKGGKLVKYTFQTLSGVPAKGSGGPLRNIPPVGATMCIVYDPENPRRNALYPLSLVRVAR